MTIQELGGKVVKSIRLYDRLNMMVCIPLDVLDMHQPVRCRCGQHYDLGKVEVTARYSDCSVWKTPCCHQTVDDRGGTGWKSFSDYEPVDKEYIRQAARLSGMRFVA